MSKNVDLYFSDFRNFGDALNRPLIEKLTGRTVRHCSYKSAELMGVGSIFYGGGFFWGPHGSVFSKDRARYYWRRLRDFLAPTLNVWGSGMLFDIPTPNDVVVSRKMKILAVRGKETLRVLRRNGVCSELDRPALGDPGLLYPYLVPECFSAGKEYDLAVIPHYLDFDVGKELAEKIERQGIKVKLIDVMQPDSINVIREISQCKAVASASLHGLIVADSLGIPNHQLQLSDYGVDCRYGEGQCLLKFQDYYSAYDEELPNALSAKDLENDAKKALDRIMAKGPIERGKVLRVKRNLLNAFPISMRSDTFADFVSKIKQ